MKLIKLFSGKDGLHYLLVFNGVVYTLSNEMLNDYDFHRVCLEAHINWDTIPQDFDEINFNMLPVPMQEFINGQFQ